MKTDLPKTLKSPHPVATPEFASQVQSLVDAYGVGSAAASPSPQTAEPAPSTLPPSLPAPGYTHAAMVELILAHPDWNYKKLAAHWGRNTAWFAAVLASDDFQRELDCSRHLIIDPHITATMEERFRALTLNSLAVLQEKLDGKEVSDLLVLKSAEIGVKALGMGNIAPVAAPPSATSIDSLAERLMGALEKQRQNVRTIDVTPTASTVHRGPPCPASEIPPLSPLDELKGL